MHKAGDTRDVSNYRPISLLHIFSKILEKFCLTNYPIILKNYKLIDSSLFSFRKNVSTSLAIVDNMQYVYDNLHQSFRIILFFLEFSEAFDYVYHDLLLENISVYAVDGVAYSWLLLPIICQIGSNMYPQTVKYLDFVRFVFPRSRYLYL